MFKKIALTGASGFIGRHVAAYLGSCNADYLMLGIDEDSDVLADVRSGEFPDCGARVLLHLAWAGLPNYGDEVHTNQWPAHLSFVRSAIARGVKTVAVAGTCFEYGMMEGRLAEDMATAPTAANKYACAKDVLRKELETITEEADVSFKWVRFFYVYGSGQRRGTLYASLLDALAKGEKTFKMSSGEQRRDFISVEEAAVNFVQIAMQADIRGIVNNCRGVPLTVKDFVMSILRERDAEIALDLGYYPESPYEPSSFWGDTAKLLKAKGAFEREYGFQGGSAGEHRPDSGG